MVDVRTNLLKNRQTLSEKDYQRERNLLRWGVFGIIVVVVLAIALSAWSLVLSRKLSGIESGITKSAKDMQGLTQASASQIYLKSRLKLVSGFLGDRSLARESLQKVLATQIPGTHVSAVAYEGETILKVQYLADTSDSLDKLLNYYQADTGYFTQVVSSGISRSKDGSYQMSLSLTLPKGDK